MTVTTEQSRSGDAGAAETCDVLVLGGAYAGIWAVANAVDVARESGQELRFVLVSETDFLAHRPRLYEKGPEELRTPVVPLLDKLGVRHVRGRAQTIDSSQRIVVVQTERGLLRLSYEKLLLATGGKLRGLPIEGAAEFTWNIDSYPAAVAFDKHLAEVTAGPLDEASTTYVIVGAGMCGLELATELRDRIGEHADESVADAARIVLVEKGDVVGPLFGDSPRPKIEEALQQAGVELRLSAGVAKVGADFVELASGERIPTRTVVVTVGMRASELADQVDGIRDELGRLHVDETLRVKGQDDIFAAGDIAHALIDGDQPSIMSCQDAKTMGKYAGRNIAVDLVGGDFVSYRQADYTTCLDLGRYGAVYTEGFDRDLKAWGQDAKKRKIWLNTEAIYPPPATTAEEIIEFLRIDAKGR